MLASEQSHDKTVMLTITLISFRKDPAQVVRSDFVSSRQYLLQCNSTSQYHTSTRLRHLLASTLQVVLRLGVLACNNFPTSGHTDRLRVPFLSAQPPPGMRTTQGLLASCPGQKVMPTRPLRLLTSVAEARSEPEK